MLMVYDEVQVEADVVHHFDVLFFEGFGKLYLIHQLLQRIETQC